MCNALSIFFYNRFLLELCTQCEEISRVEATGGWAAVGSLVGKVVGAATSSTVTLGSTAAGIAVLVIAAGAAAFSTLVGDWVIDTQRVERFTAHQ